MSPRFVDSRDVGGILHRARTRRLPMASLFRRCAPCEAPSPTGLCAAGYASWIAGRRGRRPLRVGVWGYHKSRILPHHQLRWSPAPRKGRTRECEHSKQPYKKSKQCGYNPSASHLLGTSLCTREAMRFALTSRLLLYPFCLKGFGRGCGGGLLAKGLPRHTHSFNSFTQASKSSKLPRGKAVISALSLLRR